MAISNNRKDLKASAEKKHHNILLLCVVSVVINIIGIGIALATGTSLYLDSIGTILASVLGGYMPGIITGFVTNLIKGIIDAENMYYGVINILIAICTAFFAGKGFFKGLWKPLLLILPLTVVCCLCGDFLTFFMNGAEAGNSLNTVINDFFAQVAADLPIEFADKAVSVIIAIIIYNIIPAQKRAAFTTEGWLQAPLSPEMKKAIGKNKSRKISLRTKILLILVVASVLIACMASVISIRLFRESTINEHIKLADALTGYAADYIDGDKVNEYIEKGESAEGYAETEAMLYSLNENAPDVLYAYVYQIKEDGCHVVFDLDTEDEPGGSPGDVVDFDESFRPYLSSLLNGEKIEPIISNDAFGWLLTSYEPVYDSSGSCVCYVGVDVSMNQLNSYGYSFMAKLLSLIAGFLGMVLALGVWLVEHNIIVPVKTMAYSAGAFAYNSEGALEENVERIKDLDIRTGDEIENLYRAFTKTTEDSMNYVEDIQQKTETISKMQNGLIMVLADMVERRDKCTGDHVRKTAAYVKIIIEEMKKRGFYKDQINDQFIENVENAAPLHDIGKIHISDTILNKPDKLTDEEFKIMQSHTIYGSQIIERAIETVPDSGYLEEAKKLSEYHHEKWNGKGYPHGISGEDIPLSARIMAVADVFDALVSRRSYKQPFSFEKAMSIIREDAGTHFDPLVAEAFLGAEDKVREVAESFENMNAIDEGNGQPQN